MTAWERAILEELARRYPSSAQASGGRSFRLRLEGAFPDLDRRKPDDYESFLEAAEGLESAGIVSLSWTGRNRGEELSAIVLLDPDSLYARLGRISPAEACSRSRRSAGTFGEEFPFFKWLSDTLSPKDLDPETLEPTPFSITDAARLAGALEAIARGAVPPKLTRALSVELFSDSKRIEKILRALLPHLRRAERAGIILPPYELADRSFPETFVAGRISLCLKDGGAIENSAGCILGIPFETAVKIGSVQVAAAEPNSGVSCECRLLSIENKENFFDLSSRLDELSFDALLYSGGHPNRAVQILVRRFAESGWTLFHSGDLDPDGILILQELSDSAGVPVIPWMMDRYVFDRYRSMGKTLESEAHRRALLVRDDTRRRSGLGELLGAILDSGVMVEQEIIAY